MLTTGQVITNNDSYNTTVSADNIVRHLMTAGKTWKSYAESLPYAGYTGWDTNGYVKHHNPFAYFSDVVNSSNEKQNLVPFTQFATDLNNGQLPDFSFVIPNINDDAHNGTLQQADSWLQTHIAPLLANPTFQQDGVLLVVFDEGASTDTSYGGGHVAMVVVGPHVAPGVKSTSLYQEQNILRTVLDSLGVGTYPGAAASAQDMSSMFGSLSSSSGSTTSTTGSVVMSPASGASVSSPFTVTASATANSGYNITGMYVYLDNVAVYHNSSSSVSTPVSASAGSHTVMIKAWDNSGRIYQQSASVMVGSSTSTTSTTSATGSVVISSPASGSTVSSPMTVTASARANSGYSITGMYVYLDNVAVYHNSSSSLSASVSAAAGSHTLLVKAWDNSGRIYQQSTAVNVGDTISSYSSSSSTTTTSSTGSVVLSSPAAGSTVGSPLQVTASASANSGYHITGMYVYLDNVAVYHNSSSSLSASVSASSGTHTVLVKAWDNSGRIYQQSASVNVGSTASAGSVTITSPALGATSGSPVLVQASASGGSYPITGMWVYVDNVGKYNTAASSLSTYLSMASGSHTLLVKGWNTQGTIFQKSVSVMVN